MACDVPPMEVGTVFEVQEPRDAEVEEKMVGQVFAVDTAAAYAPVSQNSAEQCIMLVLEEYALTVR